MRKKSSENSKKPVLAAGGHSLLSRTPLPDWVESQPHLQEWYSSELGQSIFDQMMDRLDHILPTVFGYQGLQLGVINNQRSLLERAGIHRPLVLASPNMAASAVSTEPAADHEPEDAPAQATSDLSQSPAQISGDVLNLPIASDVMKLVIMPHTLEFCADPYQALREADRILTNDGHIIIVGFSPWSLFGLKKGLIRWNRQVPWNGRFYPRNRITDWLSVLSYRIEYRQAFFLRPPIRSPRILKRLQVMEKNQRWLSFFGAVYLLHAKKQTVPLIPAKRLWLPHRGGGLKAGSLARVRETGARAVEVIELRSQHKSRGRGEQLDK